MDGNDINELRTILFDTIRGVSKGTIETDKAKTIVDLSQAVINTAKVEIEHIKHTQLPSATGFFGDIKQPSGGYRHQVGNNQKLPLVNKND